MLLGVECVQHNGSLRGFVRCWLVWMRFPVRAAFLMVIIVFCAQNRRRFICAGF